MNPADEASARYWLRWAALLAAGVTVLALLFGLGGIGGVR